jgi:hypothetical protein
MCAIMNLTFFAFVCLAGALAAPVRRPFYRMHRSGVYRHFIIPHQTRRQFLEKGQHLPAPQLPAHHGLTRPVPNQSC